MIQGLTHNDHDRHYDASALSQPSHRPRQGALRARKTTSLLGLAITAGLSLLTTGCGERYLVFRPVGPVGQVEKELIILSIILVLAVIIPVILLLWHIVWRYRDVPGNPAPYDPEWSESHVLEVIWWGIPIVIVGVLGAFTVRDTFLLTKPPERTAAPLTVQVTSLNWKWLFQYPDQKIATVNYCEIPTNRPIQFILSANGPMNSFWVPQLGGQEYAMPGMAMRLWLQADRSGVYYGHGANFTGRGFAHMAFNVIARPRAEFDGWVRQVRHSAPVLTRVGYQSLVQSSIVKPMAFSAYAPGIFESALLKEGGMYMKRDLTMLGRSHSHSGT